MNKLTGLLLCVVLTACASAPKWDPTTAKQLTPGVSTLADARKLFGEPQTSSPDAQGVTTQTWCADGMCIVLGFEADGTLREFTTPSVSASGD